MKITIAYLPEEEQRVNLICRMLLKMFPIEKDRKSNRNPPYLHRYLATRKPQKACNSKENA